MAEVNKINSFKSFTEIKAQGSALKLREENQTKRQELASNFTSILDEMGITSLTELDEETQRTFISKVLGKDLNEGNTFVYAASKAKADGKTEFEFNGKTYKVTIKDTGVQESVVNEAKQFDKDIQSMIKDIKSGYGWIDPEYVGDTWENTSDSIDFELVKGEIYKRLIAANLLAYPNPDDEEKKGVPVRKLQELGIKESLVTEGLSKEQKMVETFLNKIAKEFDYSIQDAVRFVKETISKMGLDESVVNESSMSDIDQMAQDSKDFKSFVKEFTKEHRDLSTAGEPGQFMDWLQSIYDDAKENMGESVVAEGAKEDALYRKQQLAKLKDAKENSKSTKRLLALQQKQNQARLKKANEAEESVITEAEINSDDEFKEYAFNVLKNAFGSDFDEDKAAEVVDGILGKADGDYGTAVGMLTSSLG